MGTNKIQNQNKMATQEFLNIMPMIQKMLRSKILTVHFNTTLMMSFSMALEKMILLKVIKSLKLLGKQVLKFFLYLNGMGLSLMAISLLDVATLTPGSLNVDARWKITKLKSALL